MRRAGLLLALTLAGAAHADPWREALHFVPSSERRASAYVGEVVVLPVAFAVGEAGFRQQVVPAFQQSTDLPLALTTPWARPPSGMRLLGLGGGGPGDVSVILDEQIGHVHRAGSRDVVGTEQRWTHYAVWGQVVFDRPGKVRLPPAVLRGALAGRFEVDPLGRRVPVEVERVVIEDEPIEIDVLPLPDAGRPPGFAGAVGAFRVQARLADPPAGSPGSARVEVLLTGDGDVSLFSAPGPGDLGGLHLLGLLDRSERGQRTFTLDLAAGDGPPSLPPLRFPHYELGPTPGYRMAATQTLPLPMLTAAATPPPPPAPAPSVGPGEERPSPWWLGLLGLLGLLPLLRRRRRQSAAGSTAPDRAALRARLADPRADLAVAFQQLLAARLDLPLAAVVAPDLALRLERAGVEATLARDAAGSMEALVAARYGSVAGAPARETLLALADRLLARPTGVS